MKISITDVVKFKKFGDLEPGDAFYIQDTDSEDTVWVPQEPYLKTCNSHGGVPGAGFILTGSYEEEFDDDDIVGVYVDFEFVGRA